MGYIGGKNKPQLNNAVVGMNRFMFDDKLPDHAKDNGKSNNKIFFAVVMFKLIELPMMKPLLLHPLLVGLCCEDIHQTLR